MQATAVDHNFSARYSAPVQMKNEFSNFASKSHVLINSPNLKIVTTEIKQKNNFEAIEDPSLKSKPKAKVIKYLTDNIYAERYSTTRGKLTPEPMLKHDKKHIRVKQVLGRNFQDATKLLNNKSCNQSGTGNLLNKSNLQEMSDEEIEIYFLNFTKKMLDSAKRAKKELLKRTICSEKLLKNMQKVKIAKKKLNKIQEKLSHESLKKIGISMIESSRRRSQMIRMHQNKLMGINKKHYNEWSQKYEKIQMVQTHRERMIVEQSMKRNEKFKEICSAIEKITKVDKQTEKVERPQSTKEKQSSHAENLRKKIAEKAKEIDEDD